MTCPSCAGQSTDNLICNREMLTMRDNLQRITGLWAELETTLTRQTKTGGNKFNGKQTKAKNVPLPFDVRASDIARDVKDTLIVWWRTFDHPNLMPADNVPSLAECISRAADLIAGHHEAPRFLDELKGLIKRIEHVIDLRPDSLCLGPCNNRTDDGNPCGRQMYANPRHDAYICPGEAGRTCGATYNIAERQGQLLELGRDMTAPIGDCAAFLARFGLATPMRTIESWTAARRGKNGMVYPPRIWAAGVNEAGTKLYRIGDMETQAKERRARKAEQEKVTA